MSKILIVDDEIRIREVIKEYAVLYGHEVKEASDGLQAIEMIKDEDFDVVILDIMMPNLDGFVACKKIKAIKKVPVIMLSARQEEFDKLMGFELGIDDYVTKPFSPKELMARIKAVTERFKGDTNVKLQFEGLVVDTEGVNVYVDQEKIHITPKEYELLVYMIKNKNTAISRDRLLEEVWNYDYFGDDRTVDTHVKMLRKNLGKYRKFIVTVRGMGYKFEV
ncbi:MAG: response regulator transcription factor [Erysipelotrichaceae bacterium]|nr:response regulator transcription factor [Erysipelotrichaceae bacterium]MDD3923659.1 response regulator transcription factor [Erysipelotrichaceae bacterium]MDD4642178.1 response regulator transcription factor [Erysipelotrichaceae bacterium]